MIGPGSQAGRILDWLQNEDSHCITQKDAILYFSCYRLSARIADLRAMGYKIDTTWEWTSTGSRFARYVYRGEPDA